MDKNNFIKYGFVAILLILIVAAAALYFSFRRPAEIVREEQLSPPEKASEPAISGTLPSIAPQVEVVVPEINPVDKANPFKDVYKNPFE